MVEHQVTMGKTEEVTVIIDVDSEGGKDAENKAQMLFPDWEITHTMKHKKGS